MSEEANLYAVVALLTTAGANAYGMDALNKLTTKPSSYTEVHVMERFTVGARFDGTDPTRYYRVLTRVVAEKYINAQRERERVTAALDGAYLTVGGVDSTQVERALSDDPIGPDEGWFSGVSEWSYAV